MTNQHISNKSQLPRRFREQSFRKFEVIINSVISAYPNVITFNPYTTHHLSQETFAARFRDAMRSYSEHYWNSNIINRERFLEVCDNISVAMAHNNSLIRIGDKNELKKPSLEVSKSTYRMPELKAVPGLIALNSEGELELICKLAALRLLSQEVKCTGFTEHNKLKYEQIYDCSIELEDGTGIASVI